MNIKKTVSLFLIAITCFSFIPSVVSASTSDVYFNILSGTAGVSNDEGRDKLMDGKKATDNSTKWAVSFNAKYGANVVIRASKDIILNGYTLTTGNDNESATGRNPKDWTLYGCNDYNETAKTSDTWTVIDSVTDDTVMQDVNCTSYYYPVDNENTYRYYKLIITANQGSSLMQLGELEFSWAYGITFDKNGGDTDAVPSSIKSGNELPTTNPTKTGFKFVGWYTKNGANGDWGDEFTADTLVTDNMTVYAKWKKNYSVTFDVNGGSWNGGTVTISHGDPLPDTEPEKTGLVFGGWYTKNGANGDWGEPYSADLTLTENITVYAKYNIHNVTYDKNGGDTDAVPRITDVSDPLPTVNPTRIGYKFIGWYTQDGTDGDRGEEYAANSAFATDTTVYAAWDSITVTFDKNGGDTDAVPDTALYGENVPTTEPTKKGFEFVGWYTKNGTNGDWGDKYSTNSPFTADTTVYAKWQSNDCVCTANPTFTALSGTEGASGENYECLVDGKKTIANFSKWCIKYFSTAEIIFKASDYTVVTGYTLTTGNDTSSNPGRNPKDWVLYACNDYDETEKIGTWTVLDSVTNDTYMEDKDYMSYTYDFDNAIAYKYYKFEVLSVQRGMTMQLAELEPICNACDHDWGTPQTVDATCTDAGYDIYTCSKCALVYENKVADPMGHIRGDNNACINCGIIYGATCNGNYYHDLQAAVDAAQDGDTIILENDTVSNDTLNISGTVTLDLNGHTHTMTGEGSVINVKKGGTFTLKDGSAEQNGRITGGNALRGGGVCNSGTFVFQNGIIENCTAETNGGGIYNTGTLTIINGTVTDCSAGNNGGGIYSDEATLEIGGGIISNNECVKQGGGVYIRYSENVIVRNAEIKNNRTSKTSSDGQGGGIVLYRTAATMEDTVIDGNSAYYGGGLFVFVESELAMNGGTVKNNSAVNYGGGVYVHYTSNAEINGTTVSNNSTTDGNGGGICVQCRSKTTINNATVSKNTATSGNGGGIFVNSSTVDINGGSIDNNNAVMSVGKNFGCGGGIFVYYNEYYKYTDDVAVNIKNANISKNTAEGNGGGIYTENAKASTDIKNSTISENKSSRYGGAIYVGDNAKAELTTAKITANTVGVGGGVCCDTDKLYLNGGVEIFGNLLQSDENQNAVPSNLYLMNQNTVTVNKSAAQTDTGNIDTKIGVTIDGGTGEITPPNDTDFGSCFLSDLSDYCVDTADNGTVKLVKAYTVTFDDGSGTINSVSVKENETVAEITEPIKNGCTFGGWFDGENGFDFSTPITKHVTLTAKWLINSENAVSVTPNKIYVSNNGTAAKVYVAAYKDGKLVDAYTTDITASTRKNISEINLNVTGADKISIFMWDNNMNPLCIGASTELN